MPRCQFKVRLPRQPGILLLVLFLLTGTSCSSAKNEDRKPVHAVRGQIFVQDKPAVGAFVLFVPENEPAQPKDPRPRAEVDADGSFKLSTYGDNDGAPAGRYIVTVTWPGTEDVEDQLSGRYSDPMTSKLRETVKEGPNELSPYRLK